MKINNNDFSLVGNSCKYYWLNKTLVYLPAKLSLAQGHKNGEPIENWTPYSSNCLRHAYYLLFCGGPLIVLYIELVKSTFWSFQFFFLFRLNLVLSLSNLTMKQKKKKKSYVGFTTSCKVVLFPLFVHWITKKGYKSRK